MQKQSNLSIHEASMCARGSWTAVSEIPVDSCFEQHAPEASFSYIRKAEPQDPVNFQKAVQKVLKRQENMVELMTLAA